MKLIMNNLKPLRVAKELTLVQIAKDLQINPTTYSQWENGKREPDISMLIKLADYFNVTLDFLVGRDYHESDCETSLYRNHDFNINKERIIPLIEKISAFDSTSINRLEGYIDGLIEKSKK